MSANDPQACNGPRHIWPANVQLGDPCLCAEKRWNYVAAADRKPAERTVEEQAHETAVGIAVVVMLSKILNVTVEDAATLFVKVGAALANQKKVQ